MRSERAQIQEKIKQQEKIAAKLLLEGNDCFEELLEGKIDDQEYTCLLYTSIDGLKTS